MLTAVYTIFVFCLIIAVHEFGHFAVSKLTGMTVHEFSIGMGPKLFTHHGKKTDYSLRLLPIGGYVKLEGEDEASDDANAFCNKKPWQRLCVLFAGAFMNFVLGFLIFVLIFSCSEGITTNKVGKVVEGSAFDDAGILAGDEIICIESSNGKSSDIHSYNDIQYFMSKNESDSLVVTFRRDGKIFEKTIVPRYDESLKAKIMGFMPLVEKPVFSNVISSSYRQSGFVIKAVLDTFKDLFTGEVSFSNFSGPVGIVNEIGSAAKAGMSVSLLAALLNVLSLAALISINLGVVNLLPLPALDGGRILFIIIELIRRKPIEKEKEGMFHLIGFVLLIILMISITFFDIQKLLVKWR